jgi:pimeloyl-ACP methyl ester carboxylesterase
LARVTGGYLSTTRFPVSFFTPVNFDPSFQASNLGNGIQVNRTQVAIMYLTDKAAFAALSAAGFQNNAFQYSAGKSAVCVTGLVPVSVKAQTFNVLYNGPKDNYELTEFITSFLRVGSTTIQNGLGAPKNTTGTFNIYSKLCIPAATKDAKSLKSVQFISHGAHIDSSYWDFAEGYSYVDAAAEKGFATFTYDRLGSGKSDHPPPHQIVQVPLQVEIAHELIKKLKTGTLGNTSFKQVVAVGHSFGSGLSQSLSVAHPDDVDALVLTGHTAFQGGSLIAFAGSAQQMSNSLPDRPELKSLPNGYISLGPTAQDLQFGFYYYPHFEEKSKHCFHRVRLKHTNTPSVFKKNLKTRQNTNIGEFFTLGTAYTPNFAWVKPVMILNGNEDYSVCQGNCTFNGTDVTAQALAAFFPNVPKNKSAAVNLPNLSHNMHLHLSRQDIFATQLDFITKTAGIKA